MKYTHKSKKVPDEIMRRVKGVDGIARKQIKMPTVEVKSLDPGAPMTIAGFANEITPDRGQEQIPPSAWDLKNFQKNPIMLWEHTPWEPIGYCTLLAPTDEGLKFEARIGDPSSGHPLTRKQEEVRSLIAQGVLRSLSVGFIPWEWEYDEKSDLLIYKKCELLEISVVAIPMQQSSQINEIKRYHRECEIMADKEEEKPQSDDEVGYDREILNSIKTLVEESVTLSKSGSESLKAIFDKVCGEPKPDEEEAKTLKATVAEQQATIERLQAEIKEAHDYIGAVHKRLDALLSAAS